MCLSLTDSATKVFLYWVSQKWSMETKDEKKKKLTRKKVKKQTEEYRLCQHQNMFGMKNPQLYL